MILGEDGKYYFDIEPKKELEGNFFKSIILELFKNKESNIHIENISGKKFYFELQPSNTYIYTDSSNKTEYDIMILKIYPYDDIQNISIDIQNKKINNKINFIDKFWFLFSKLFNINNKKQLYLKRIEKLIINDLSIDNFFLEIHKMKKMLNKNINANIDKINIEKYKNSNISKN